MKTKVRNIGVDIGYGFVKATAGSNKYIFPSVVGEAREIRYKTDLTKNSTLNNLIIEVDNNRYFVGDLAIRQSELIQSTISDKRINSIENRVLFLTAFALLDGIGTGVSKFNLVTGLPVDEYLQYKDLLIDKLTKDHVIKLVNGTKNDNKLIQTERCKVIPQPFGTIFNKLLDDYGNIQDKELASMNIGVIDIGFRTSDYAVANKLEFVDKLSSSTTTALSTAYRIISRKLKEVYLGFYFKVVNDYNGPNIKAIFGPSNKSIKKFKEKVREITKRNQTTSAEVVIAELNKKLTGWGNYFGIGYVKRIFTKLDGAQDKNGSNEELENT